MEGNVVAGGISAQAGQNTSAGANVLTNIFATASTTVAGTAITAATVSGNTVTITAAGTWAAGNVVTIAGLANNAGTGWPAVNGTQPIAGGGSGSFTLSFASPPTSTATVTTATVIGPVTNEISGTASTLSVASSTGFNSSGGEFTITHNSTPYRILYTGTGTGTLTGCTTPDGAIVNFSVGDGVIGGNGTGVGTNATAYQLCDLRRDYLLGLNVTTAGTATTLSLGPTSAVGTYVPISNTALPTGLYTVKVPAGWYVKLTTTSGVAVLSAITE